MPEIHPSAVVEEGAVLGEGCRVGAFSVIGPHVIMGENCNIASHVVVEGHTRLGNNNRIFQFASIGSAPQDLKFRDEASELHIGDNNTMREYVTLQPGTEHGTMLTTIGNSNLFMASSHVGHDCRVGDANVFANSCALSGHVTIENNVILGGLAGVHQFARVGDLAFVGGGSMAGKDVPPFCITQGDRAALVGINVIGLKRNGFSVEDIGRIRKLYRDIFLGKGKLEERLNSVEAEYGDLEAAVKFINFIRGSKRGLTYPRKEGFTSEDDIGI